MSATPEQIAVDEKALEAVAREICKRDTWNFGGPDAIVDSEWDDNGTPVAQAPAWQSYVPSARAAIEAYRWHTKFDDVRTADLIDRLRGFPITYPVAHEAADALSAQAERVRVLESALKQINQTLCVPAAEYVPAIRDCFDIIDAARAALRGEA